MAMKKREGTIGFIKGMAVEIKTTRTFRYDKISKRNVRGVQLWLLNEKDYERRKEFPEFGLAMRLTDDRSYDSSSYSAYIFVDILEFRKQFVTHEAANILYGKN